jgi:hypothetical protein
MWQASRRSQVLAYVASKGNFFTYEKKTLDSDSILADFSVFANVLQFRADYIEQQDYKDY